MIVLPPLTLNSLCGGMQMGEKFSKPQDKDAYNKSIKLEACCQALASRITKRILRKAR